MRKRKVWSEVDANFTHFSGTFHVSGLLNLQMFDFKEDDLDTKRFPRKNNQELQSIIFLRSNKEENRMIVSWKGSVYSTKNND